MPQGDPQNAGHPKGGAVRSGRWWGDLCGRLEELRFAVSRLRKAQKVPAIKIFFRGWLKFSLAVTDSW